MCKVRRLWTFSKLVRKFGLGKAYQRCRPWKWGPWGVIHSPANVFYLMSARNLILILLLFSLLMEVILEYMYIPVNNNWKSSLMGAID